MKVIPKKIVVLSLVLGAILTTTVAAAPTRDQVGITPKQLSGLTSTLQRLDGEITDLRLLTDRTAAVVVSGKRGWQLYVFNRVDETNWKEVWTSGTLGDEFSFAEPDWKVYFSSCGPVVFQFDGCRKYECSTVWGIIIYDAVSGEVAEAQSLDGNIKFSGKPGHDSRGCAKEQLQKVIAEKGLESSQR
ncbi:MAG: hypothetical protein ACLP7O_05610 [Terracidiphilus sp.]